jgi:hypothetical protein
MSMKLTIGLDGDVSKISDEQRRNLFKLAKTFNETKVLLDDRIVSRKKIASGKLTGWDLEREEENVDFMDERLNNAFKDINDILATMFDIKV